jgi:hypothetical protein
MIHARSTFRWFTLIAVGLMVLVSPLFPGLGQHQANVQAAACWKAEITEQWTDLDLAGSVLRVAVHGKPGLQVIVRSLDGFETSNVTGTKPEYGPNVAEFAPLSLGTYFIEPQGLGVVFEIWLDGKNYTRVDFTPLPCAATATPKPPAATPVPGVKTTATPLPQPTATPLPVPTAISLAAGWHGRVVEHTENPGGGVYFATVAVRVIGRPAGQAVEIRSNGWNAVQKTGTKPEFGPDACEFGALNPGTYRLTPTDLGVNLDVTVAHGDFVLVEFYQTGVGGGTRWVGSVVENTSGSQPTLFVNSAIAVVVSGKPWYEVEIRSDGWSTTCQTGYKPEYGPDACEFGGLRAATYTIIPKDLGASVEVTVDGSGWAMVRFDQVAVPVSRPAQLAQSAQPSQPTAQPAQASQPESATTVPTASPQSSPTATGVAWKGWVVSNSSVEGDGTGVSSVIVVRVLNWAGIPVTITGGGGWSATCITGTKPEYGSDACEFGGLWPSTYTLRPQGADVEVEVTMDGIGVAFVSFSAR